MSRLIDALHSGKVLLMDGAMGTELQRLGLDMGSRPDEWNTERPEVVASVHWAYRNAGADVLLTHTFQANPATYAAHDMEHRLGDTWRAAFANALAIGEPRPLLLADVGPFEDATPARLYRLLTVAWICGHADGVLFETMMLAQFRRLVPALHTTGISPPLLASFTFMHAPVSRRLCTFHDNTTPEECAREAERHGAVALGANCGNEIDMDDMLEIVRRYRSETTLPIFVRPNAGTPKRTASGFVYPQSPRAMADQLWPLLEAGVTMVGGCCGTTPEHTAAFRRVVDLWNARSK